jgi:hypothetical protein
VCGGHACIALCWSLHEGIAIRGGHSTSKRAWLQELLREETAEICKEMKAKSLDHLQLHTAVRDYLVAHAFVDTLQRFDRCYSQRAQSSLCAAMAMASSAVH